MAASVVVKAGKARLLEPVCWSRHVDGLGGVPQIQLLLNEVKVNLKDGPEFAEATTSSQASRLHYLAIEACCMSSFSSLFAWSIRRVSRALA
jgi:hypothetical protein